VSIPIRKVLLAIFTRARVVWLLACVRSGEGWVCWRKVEKSFREAEGRVRASPLCLRDRRAKFTLPGPTRLRSGGGIIGSLVRYGGVWSSISILNYLINLSGKHDYVECQSFSSCQNSSLASPDNLFAEIRPLTPHTFSLTTNYLLCSAYNVYKKSGLLSPNLSISASVLPSIQMSLSPARRLAFSRRRSTCWRMLPPSKKTVSYANTTACPGLNRGLSAVR
jgi:hypothetical protein